MSKRLAGPGTLPILAASRAMQRREAPLEHGRFVWPHAQGGRGVAYRWAALSAAGATLALPKARCRDALLRRRAK
jgi:hypothetical protein